MHLPNLFTHKLVVCKMFWGHCVLWTMLSFVDLISLYISLYSPKKWKPKETDCGTVLHIYRHRYKSNILTYRPLTSSIINTIPSNGYIDASLKKVGVPGLSGCNEQLNLPADQESNVWHIKTTRKRTTPLTKRSRSHRQFKCKHTYVRSKAVLPIFQ